MTLASQGRRKSQHYSPPVPAGAAPAPEFKIDQTQHGLVMNVADLVW